MTGRSTRVTGRFATDKDAPDRLVKDLHTFVDLLEKRGQLKRITAPVTRDLEIAETSRPSLAEIPILQCWPEDGGRFITLPLVISRHPVTGKRNVGMYRMQVYDDQTTGMHWHLHKGGAEHYRRAEHGGQRVPIAV